MSEVGSLNARVSLDTAEFRQGIQSLNQQMQIAREDFRLATGSLDRVQNALDIARERATLLSSQMSAQTQIVDRYRQAHAQAVTQFGEGSRQAQSYLLRLRQAENQLSSISRQIENTNEQIRIQSSRWTTLGNTLQNVRTRLSGIGDGLKNIGQTMSMAVTAPILAAGAASFKMASDLNETINKVDVAFKGNAAEVQKWGATTLKNFGIAKSTALDMAALYGDMATSMGLSTDASAKMSKGLVGLAGDMASFKNVGIDQVNTALKSIFTGETEPLKNLGIVMTEVNLKAYLMSQGIKKSWEEMSQAERVNIRYQYVLENTKNSQGDFARTGAGTANQMRIFQETLKELGATIGQQLLPIITPLIVELNNWLMKLKEMSPEGQRLTLIIAGIAAVIPPLLIVMGSVISAVTTLAGVFATASASIATAGGIIAVLTGPIGITIAAIAGLIAIGVALYQNWDLVKAKGLELLEFMKPTWELIKTTINDAIQSVIDFVQPQIEKIMIFWKENGEQITSIIKTTWGIIIDLFNIQFQVLKLAFETTWILISGIVSNAWNLIKGAILIGIDLVLGIIQTGLKILKGDWSGAWETIKQTVSSIWMTITETIKSINLFQVGKDIIQGLINGLSNMLGSLMDTAKGIAKSVSDTIKTALKISSPSKVMMELGQYTVQGLVSGIDMSKVNVNKSMTNVSNDMIDGIRSKNNNAYTSQNTNQASQAININLNLDGKVIAQYQYQQQRQRSRGLGVVTI